MNLVHYPGFGSAEAACEAAESLSLSRKAVVLARYMGAYYAIASGSIDRCVIIGRDLVFKKSHKDGTFKCQRHAEFKRSYPIDSRVPRQYTDTILQELLEKDPPLPCSPSTCPANRRSSPSTGGAITRFFLD